MSDPTPPPVPPHAPPQPPTYAAQPPPPTGGMPYPPRPPGPPPAHHRSGKGRTIALIVVGVVVVGTLGGIVGAALGGSPDTDLATRALETPTAEPSPTGTASGILDPTPVGTPTLATDGTTSPEPTGPTQPTDEPSLPTRLPTPTPTVTPPPSSGDSVSIFGGQVQVALPSGWKTFNQGEDSVTITDEDGSYVYVLAGAVDSAKVDAASIINQQVDSVLPPEQYSGLDFGDVTPLDPAGSVVSIAQLEYAGTWVDPQSPIPFHGLLYALVRSDGTAMILTAEHAPPDRFEDSIDEIQRAVQPTLAMFAGL